MVELSQETQIPSPFSLMELIIGFPVLNLVARIQKLPLLQSCRGFFSLLFLFFSGSSTNATASHGAIGKTTRPTEAAGDGGSVRIRREEVEMVMDKLLVLSMGGGDDHPSSGAHHLVGDSLGVEDLSSLFEEDEPTMEEVKEAFSVFDRNCDGFIDAQDLQVALLSLGYRGESTLSIEECGRMISVHDQDMDGRIDLQEFVKFMEENVFN